MIRSLPSADERVLDALVDRALFGLDDAGTRVLQEVDPALLGDEFTDLDLAVAAVDVVFSEHESESMPGALRDIVAARLGEASRRAPVAGMIEPRAVDSASVIVPSGDRDGWLTWGGWVAAGLAALVALAVWLGGPEASAPASPGMAPVQARQNLLAAASDISRGVWQPWDGPEVVGVTGDVVWSDARQEGYLRLVGLPENDTTIEQYQLWIVDQRGLFDPTGQSARISGGVFDVSEAARDPETGDVIVPIRPAIEVQGAAAFAVTIERPGGVWVSDMSRRVVIAEVSG